MNSSELRSTLALAGIFGLRMLGLFLLLPVFSLHARDLPGGQNALWVGLALGIFNIVQAFFIFHWGPYPIELVANQSFYGALAYLLLEP
jgi:hypothetical protein